MISLLSKYYLGVPIFTVIIRDIAMADESSNVGIEPPGQQCRPAIMPQVASSTDRITYSKEKYYNKRNEPHQYLVRVKCSPLKVKTLTTNQHWACSRHIRWLVQRGKSQPTSSAIYVIASSLTASDESFSLRERSYRTNTMVSYWSCLHCQLNHGYHY